MLSSKIIWKANVGKNCRIIIKGKGKITLSNGVYIDDYCTLEANDGVIEIEKGCYFNNYSRIVSKSFIRIGRDCLFGSNVSIYNHDHDVSEGVLMGKNKYIIIPVEVGNFVWCCTNVVITKECKIKNNCVIGANSVVTDNVTGNSIYGGYPQNRSVS